MKSKKNLLALACAASMSVSMAATYNVIVSAETNDYYTPEWETFYKYSEWEDVGAPYDCTHDYRTETSAYYKDTTCKQDQERSYDEYEKEINYGRERFIEEGVGTESQTIDTSSTIEVASVNIESVSGSFNVPEGDSGVNTIELKLTLNKSFADEDFAFSYNTQDQTTSSVLDKAQNLVYDEFGNPFISVVDNANGGKLIFDGGFPKYYNTNWNGATDFNSMPIQFKFMHNIVNWISEEHKDRGKVLIYGDAIEGHNYSVHEGDYSDFNTSIPSAVNVTGFTPVIKAASHSDFNGSKSSDRKVDLTLEEMNKYSSIILMSSGGWESLSNESANNFTTYVNNGGGVYIITDHGYFQETGNQVLRKFGSEFYGFVDRTASHNAYKLSTIWSNLSGTEYGSDHPLWSGLSSTESIPAGGSEGNVRLFTPTTDIIATSGVITFAAGEVEKFVTLQVNGDSVKENNETFKFMIQAGENGYVSDDQGGQVITIIDDD